MKLEPYATMPSRFWVRRGDVVEKFGVDAAASFFRELCPGDKPMSAVKYFTLSFGTDEEFSVLAIAEELKKEAWEKVFIITVERNHCVLIIFVCKELRSNQRQILSDEFSF